MTKSVLVALLLGAALVTWTGSGTAYSAHLPTHGDVVHFDLNPAASYDTLLRWPGIPAAPDPVIGGKPPTYAGSFEGGEFANFTDALQGKAPQIWENEIQNPTAITRTFKVAIRDDNPLPLVRTFWVTLDPGWSVVFDLHVSEGMSEMGDFTWLAGSLLKYKINVDSSVTENKLATPDPYPFPCNENYDGCLAVYFVDPVGNVLLPKDATGGKAVSQYFTGCPDVFFYKINSQHRVPWFAKLRCMNGRLVLLVGEKILTTLYPAGPPSPGD
jgi:hypothetical protein